jgi:diguanylate cyclase (GGDEF)-like protein
MEVIMPKKQMMSLSSRSLRYKLKIAFTLMTILPLLVSLYIIMNYSNVPGPAKIYVFILMSISVAIAVVGFMIIKEVSDRLISVTAAAKSIALDGSPEDSSVGHMDEVGDLSDALSQMTQRIRSNMDELKVYSEKTKEINIETQQRVMMLSGLLQISSLISLGARLEDIIKVISEKAKLLATSDSAYLLFREENQEAFYMKTADGMNVQQLMKINIDPKDDLFGRVARTNKPLVLDTENSAPEMVLNNFFEKFGLKNTIALPVYLMGRVMAILGIGNTRESFTYSKEDLELLDIFAKQISIALENNLLMHRVETLEIKDALTGAYNEGFIRNRLQEEIKRAITYQRPCSFVMFNIDNFQKYRQEFGTLQAEAILKRVSTIVRDSVSEIDRVGRTGGNEFAIVLPEKNKRKAQDLAEDIRKKIEYTFMEERDPSKRLTISGGVSENPLDGISAEELIIKARELVDLAKKQGKNRILGLKEPPTCL